MEKNKDFEYGLQNINEMTITLTLEDDAELLCGVAIFPVEYKDYTVLLPLKEETDEVFIYRFKQTESLSWSPMLLMR